MGPTSGVHSRVPTMSGDELDIELARDARETRQREDRVARFARIVIDNRCLLEGHCEPRFARAEEALAVASLAREVTLAELRQYFERHCPRDVDSAVQAAARLAGLAAEVALQSELLGRLQQANEMLGRLATDRQARLQLVLRLLEIPDGTKRMQALQELGLTTNPQLARHLREYEHCLKLRDWFHRDPLGFLAEAQRRLADPSRAGALGPLASQPPGLTNPLSFQPELFGMAEPTVPRLAGPTSPWPGGTTPPWLVGAALQWDSQAQQAVLAAVNRQPALGLLLNAIFSTDALNRMERQIMTQAAAMRPDVARAAGAVADSQRSDSPLALLRDCQPAMRALLGDTGEGSVLALGVVGRIQEREADYGTWARLAAATKFAVRLVLAAGTGGIAGGLLGSGAGTALEAGEAGWARDVMRGLVSVGAADHYRLEMLRTPAQAAGQATLEAAWDTAFGLAGHALGVLGVVLTPNTPRNPLAPHAR